MVWEQGKHSRLKCMKGNGFTPGSGMWSSVKEICRWELGGKGVGVGGRRR